MLLFLDFVGQKKSSNSVVDERSGIMGRQKETMNDKIQIFTDGGSRGNPGNAAIGVYIIDSKEKELYSLGEPIGIATNNVAEYRAVIAAFKWLTQQSSVVTGVNFFLDSELVCRQLTGVYKVKNEDLRGLLYSVHEMKRKLSFPITFLHIPREKNKKADLLVNMALDKNSVVSYNKS